jgi:hypothetical protein
MFPLDKIIESNTRIQWIFKALKPNLKIEYNLNSEMLRYQLKFQLERK